MNPEKDQLIVVDAQNGFVLPKERGGELPVPTAEERIAYINDLIDEFHEKDQPVIFTGCWHAPDDPSFIEQGGSWIVHCVRNTPGAKFHGNLLFDGELDHVALKGMGEPEAESYSGWKAAKPFIKSPDTHLYVCGFALDFCVKATILDARAAGHPVTLVIDATAEVFAEKRNPTLYELAAAGVDFRSTLELIA